MWFTSVNSFSIFSCFDLLISSFCSHMASHPANAKYPDTVALTYDETNHKIACVYSDRSIYLWDITDIRKVTKWHSIGNLSLNMFFPTSIFFSVLFYRWENRIRFYTTPHASGVSNRILPQKKVWKVFCLLARLSHVQVTTPSEFGIWILIWALIPSIDETSTAM